MDQNLRVDAKRGGREGDVETGVMTHPNSRPDDSICPNCQGSVAVRNPTGWCDHLYWPDMLTPEAREKIGPAELARIQRECMREVARALHATVGNRPA